MEDYVYFLRMLVSPNTSTNMTALERLYGSSEAAQVDPSSTVEEMKVKQLTDVSDTLKKLHQDLSFSFARSVLEQGNCTIRQGTRVKLNILYFSFSREFSAEPLDGVSLLMDVLRAIQMARALLSG